MYRYAISPNADARMIFGSILLCALLIFAAQPANAIRALVQDGPVSVNLGDVFRKGEVKIDPYDLKEMPPLPDGYAVLNDKGYRITTTAVATGPFTVHFSAASIGDQDTFNNLRIFHAEPDPFDPEAPVWVDCTGDSSDAPAPNFSNRTLDSFSEELGVFVIGRLVHKLPPSTAAADLEVTCNGSPDPVTSPDNVMFVVKVTNKGPQPASEVGMVNEHVPQSRHVSVVPSQGTCKVITGTLYCKLGSLAVDATATIQVTVKPDEGTRSFPQGGAALVSDVWASAKEADINSDNNAATGYVRAFPNPNLPPGVTITSPTASPEAEAVFVGPATIAITAKASDPDGTISKVEFFDNGKSIGLGETLDGSRFVITEQNVLFGRHFLEALATDNGGRQGTAFARVLVNGSAKLHISSPSDGSVISPGGPLIIKANASHPTGIITKVEFFANSMSLGEGTKERDDTYTLRLSHPWRIYREMTAVATDGSGVTTTSSQMTVKVTERPVVNLLTPLEGKQFPANTNISVSARASQLDGAVAKIDFYANDVLIGTDTPLSRDTCIVTWRHIAAGTYTLTAVATNDLGVTTKSAPVRITVGNPALK